MAGQGEDFSTAQARLLAQSGTPFKSQMLTIHEPAAHVQRVHVLETGEADAPPVLFIHGGNSVAAAWEPLLSALSGDVHCYAPDRPGCGLTDMVDYRGVRFREHAVAFVGAVLDALNVPRASLLGNSMGGYWALLYALAHPERVERVVLVGEPAGSAPIPTMRHRLLCTPGLNRLLYATVLKPNRNRTRQQQAMIVAHPERLSETFLDLAYAAAVLPGAQRAWLSMLETVWPIGRKPELTYALSPALHQLQCPTLLVWGDRDLCPPQWGRQLSDQIPQARLEIVPDAGHVAWLDAPLQVEQLLREFLRSSGHDPIHANLPGRLAE